MSRSGSGDAEASWETAVRLAALVESDLSPARSIVRLDDLGAAHVLLHAGRLAECEALIERARLAEDPGDLAQKVLALLDRGVVAALRGDRVAAGTLLDDAVDRAASAGDGPLLSVARAVRAEMRADEDPQRALADGRAALEDPLVGRHPTWAAWAARGIAIAMADMGHAVEVAAAALLELGDLSPIEHGRRLLLLGEVAVEHDPRLAAPYFEGAARLLERNGAVYWAVRALHALARAKPGAAANARRRALRSARDDVAYDRLLGPSRGLEVRVLGAASVLVGGEQVDFATSRAELLVYMLALAGEAGMHWEVVAERLWPGASPARSAASLRTALWHARRALGSEAWRLARRRSLLVLDLTDRPCDLVALSDLVRREDASVPELRHASELLQQPVLAPWRFEEWVAEVEDTRARLAARVAERIAGRS